MPARPPSRQLPRTSQPETAIAQNSTDQTKGNAQLGGVQLGLRIFAYHSSGRKNAPVEAAPKLSMKNTTSAKIEDNVKATPLDV